MTRKCVLCKGTNYKNTYSFFSAPKDAETRQKWQEAIGIENYEVTDDTYVCSKHFHKNDIITHWVSGVPPHVITIKYKKCRLRPGAVPNKSINMDDNIHMANDDRSNDSDINMNDFLMFREEKGEEEEDKEKESFVIPRTKEQKEEKEKKYKTLNYRFRRIDSYGFVEREQNDKTQSSKEDSTYPQEETNVERLENTTDTRENAVYLKEDAISSMDVSMNSEDMREEQSLTDRENSVRTESSARMFNTSELEDTSTEMWEQKVARSNIQQAKYKEMYIKKEMLSFGDSLDSHGYSAAYSETEENEMLFEDLLENFTEVILPRGWSCLVTSKGRGTTVVYLYMGMTKSGMPYTEKQVFVKSDMVLRCSVVNREINPIIHNLIREGKHLKVQNLLDVEELIDEFDQRIVCQGLHTTDVYQVNSLAYKDGIRWRHVLCPLLLNNDSSRCTRCIALSDMLTKRAKNLLPFRYNPVIYVRKGQRVHTVRQMRKRTRKHERRYEYKT